MKKLKLIVLLMLLCSCSGQYWHGTAQTASGRHERYNPGWGGGCPAFSQPQYIKASNYNNLADYRHPKIKRR